MVLSQGLAHRRTVESPEPAVPQARPALVSDVPLDSLGSAGAGTLSCPDRRGTAASFQDAALFPSGIANHEQPKTGTILFREKTLHDERGKLS